MTRPHPVNQEREFGFHELFFSITDLRGIIQFGNEVFFRVAGYTPEQGTGSPHNLIRHPDMPKAIFKLLWDRIQAGEMIAAYVKNMASDGAYYWVLALVFPVGEKYLSIRLKPSSPIFDAARKIYADVLREEKEKGVEASGQLLFSALESAGFKTYDQFMAAALKSEIQARDRALNSVWQSSAQSKAGAISEISDKASHAADLYRATFDEIRKFEEVGAVFRDTTEALFKEMDGFRLLALNMRVLASQVGHEGASLAVVTENFQSLVVTLEECLRAFSAAVATVCDGMEKGGLEICALKLQMDMVDFFVRESLGMAESGRVSPAEAFAPLEVNSQAFLDLSARYTKGIETRLNSLDVALKSLANEYRGMRKSLNGVELISQIGAVEASRMDAKHDFGHYIARMREFATLLRNSIHDLGRATGSLTDSLQLTSNSLKQASPCTPEIFRIARGWSLRCNSSKDEEKIRTESNRG